MSYSKNHKSKINVGMIKSIEFSMSALNLLKRDCPIERQKAVLSQHINNLQKLKNTIIYEVSSPEFDFGGVIRQMEQKLIEKV